MCTCFWLRCMFGIRLFAHYEPSVEGVYIEPSVEGEMLNPRLRGGC